MLEVGKTTTGLKKVLATWAKEHSAMAAKERQLGGSGKSTASYLIGKNVILKKVKEALGLDQCLLALTGAAPLAAHIMEYFASLDIDLLEVYGMSESTGGTTLNTPSVHQFGSVGPPVGPIEVKVEHVPGRDAAGEGEVCYRGRSIMMGYMKEPGKTQEAIDAQGWLHSGDVGRLSTDGNHMLKITGRIKELIITAGGENIAPVPIEDKFKQTCPAVSNAMMVGDKRKYNVMIVTVKTMLDPESGLSTGDLAADALAIDPNVTTSAQVAAAAQDPSSLWAQYLATGLAEVNSNKFAVSNAQKGMESPTLKAQPQFPRTPIGCGRGGGAGALAPPPYSPLCRCAHYVRSAHPSVASR